MTPSITNQPVFKPKTSREVYMEDVKCMSLALINRMNDDLKISMSIEDEDKFYDSLLLFLEESFNWPDYKNYN